MNSEPNDFYSEEIQESNLKDILFKYLHHWKVFLVSLSVCLGLGYTYLRFHPPLYEVKATILIKDDSKGGSMTDELSTFDDLGIFKKKSNIDNEIEILKSRALMSLVVKELNLTTLYYSKGRPIEHERYTDTPIRLRYVFPDSTTLDTISEFKADWILIPESNTTFNILEVGGILTGQHKFGDSLKVANGKVVFTKTTYFNESYLNYPFRVKVVPLNRAVDSYVSSIKVDPVNKTSNAITIILRDPILIKAADIINNLIKQHYIDAITDKNQVSKNTADFINDRIKYIKNELSQVEGEVEAFKSQHKLSDLQTDAELFVTTETESQKALNEANAQFQVAAFMYEYVTKESASLDLVPANLGLTDVSLSLQINEYNNYVLERNRILKHSSDKNPAVETLNVKLISLKASIQEGLKNLKLALQIKVKELEKQEGLINGRIATMPKFEREFRTIERQQQIKETLYLYLLKKREETNLALAVSVANAKVIDKAYSNGEVVEPKKTAVYLASILFGLLLPVVAFYLLSILDTKIHSQKDLERIKIPYLGDIPKSSSKNKLVVAENDRSTIAESFRLLRTNVDFMIIGSKTKARTILVTSTIGKEGKSFVALNLAASIHLSGKKVLLMGMDLRVPKILEYLHLDDKPGLTDYITNSDLSLRDLIFNAPGMAHLDILASGALPPNPNELLRHPRVKELFDTVKAQYEYVIIDSAPVGLVSDTLLVSEYADCTIFVVRANYLDKRLLNVVEGFAKERRLPNMAALINCSDTNRNYGYGYGYREGYGYGNEKTKPWWKKILDQFNS
jgi:tyrosine-protein kinase Etk/Wzc